MKIYAITLAAVLAAPLLMAEESDESIVTGAVRHSMSDGSYWTRERMLAAKPYPMPTREGAPRALPREEPMATSLGGDESGALPRHSMLLGADDGDILAISGALAQPTDEAEPRLIVPQANGYDYPPPNTTYFVPKSFYSLYPYYAVGKVFFSSGGGNYVCSGSSAGNHAVLTAGHCVAEGDGVNWHDDWAFVPAYYSGQAPYGTWYAYYLLTTSSWFNSGSFCRDVGFAAVSEIGGISLADKVGYLGFSYNKTRVQHFDAFGFPAAAPYSGKYLVQTEASFAEEDSPGCTPNTIGIGSPQTGGSSGGPWIGTFYPDKAGKMNYANGVNSYKYTGYNYEMFSPYFDSEIKKLRDQAVKK